MCFLHYKDTAAFSRGVCSIQPQPRVHYPLVSVWQTTPSTQSLSRLPYPLIPDPLVFIRSVSPTPAQGLLSLHRFKQESSEAVGVGSQT